MHHVNPQGAALLTCALGQKFDTGERVTFPAIAAHRNANYTSCPGDRLYALLPGVRKAVAAIGLPKIYDFAVSQQHVSPNADGVQDRTVVVFRISESADWRVDVKDVSGATVRSLSGSGKSVSVTWDGRDDAGDPLPDGAFGIVASARGVQGQARVAVATVRLDTVAPGVQSVDVGPDPFSPNGDGWADRTSLAYTPQEACSARVWLRDQAGDVMRRLTDWRDAGVSRRRVAWDGRVAGADGALAPAAEARFVMELTLRDRAGNRTTVRRGVSVDRTLGFAKAVPAIFSPNGDGTRDTASLGFRLTRRADVTVRGTKDGGLQRTVAPGSFAAGSRSVVWDGGLSGGATATSGSYRFSVTATGVLGRTTASGTCTVDRYTPRLSAPATASVALGRTVRIPFTVRDAYSPKVKVWVTVTGADGAVVATITPGWVTQGAPHVCAWKPPKRRRYTLAFRAIDRGGNHQNTVVRTTLAVR